MFGLTLPDLMKIGGGVVLACIGYIVKRWVERRSAHEDVDLFTKIANMKAALEGAGMSVEDAQSIAVLMGARLRKISPPQVLGRETEEERLVTQAEMTQEAINGAQLANAKLEGALANLRRLLTESEQELLEKAQNLWEQYRDAQAQLAAMIAEGGSIQPLLEASASERLTLDRLKFVEQSVAEHRAVGG